MYRPQLTIKANGLPVVSNDELDVIGERLIADFCPIATLVPQEIDIDRFVVNYLKMELLAVRLTVIERSDAYDFYRKEDYPIWKFAPIRAKGRYFLSGTLSKRPLTSFGRTSSTASA